VARYEFCRDLVAHFHRCRHKGSASYVVTSATSIYLLGVAGFAAAADYSYFIMDGFTSRMDNFVSAIVNFFAAMDCSPP
jgi:hypothetical protein